MSHGRCLSKCEFADKTVSFENKQIYNGIRLLQFTDAAELSIANSMNCCEGFFTRIVNDQKSAIDYILLSKIMCKNVDSVFIDESGKYDLHSDHVILSIQINDVHIPKKHSNVSNKF